MKNIVFGALGALALAFSAPASAADLRARPYTPPPPIAAIYDWSGFYIGANGGGGWSNPCWDFVDTTGALTGTPGQLVNEGCNNVSGGTVGGQIGYRWQSTQWVFGIEGQGNWADFTGDRVSLLFPALRNRTRTDAFGLITGQVGYAWNNVLFYVKGGGAVVGTRYDIHTVVGDVLAASVDSTRWGGTVGAGVEFGFAQNWSVGFEYDHIFLNHRDVDFVTPGGFAFGTDRVSQDVDLALVRVNYRWGGGPAFPRY